jgi:carbohydrate kinase (thermoresistant glucokinase family)
MRSANADIYVIMGVAGSGKSRIGAAFARVLDIPFVEGDDDHPAENVERMARGEPLTDAHRAGWLRVLAERIHDADAAGTGLVVTCSALKRAYRDVLRAGATHRRVQFVFLHGPRDLLRQRLGDRRGHFMPVSLLDSQLGTLEEPAPDELAWVCDITQPPDALVASLAERVTA